ncbi:MAG: synthase subunit [Thermoleophilia bacterium]|nr:synthase subunit [Thermoleophilia bacterium]
MTTVSPTATAVADSKLAQQDVPPAAPRKPSLLGRLFFPVVFAALAVWGVFIALGDPVVKEKFDPTEEFDLSHAVIGGHWEVAGIDLSINKGVVYLALALLGSALFALYVYRTASKRNKVETKTQSGVEAAYEFAYDQIAGSLPNGKLFNRYMPFVASVFIFIWFLNMISFVPLPLGHEFIGGDGGFLRAFGVYAVSSNIFCTITLAILTFGIYHYEGVKAHGLLGYLKTWSAGQKGPVLILVYPVEILTNLVLKPVSLAVRLFANMLSGHVLILLMMALAGVIGGSLAVSIFAQTMGTGIALVFYLFEMGLVASLQAFIFAVLSAIYISSAAEEHH